jgi:hypothetical protein
MPEGKPAGVRCIHLGDDDSCQLFGKPERPDICSQFQATPQYCGNSAGEALLLIEEIERLTKPE